MGSTSRSKSRSRAATKKEKVRDSSPSTSPVRKPSSKKVATPKSAKKTPSKAKTPSKSAARSRSRSRSTSRSRIAPREKKEEPKSAPRPVGRPRSSSRSRTADAGATPGPAKKIQTVKPTFVSKATPLQSSSTFTSSTRPSRTFERADDDVRLRTFRTVTQSRERPVLTNSSPKKINAPSCGISTVPSVVCKKVCSTGSSAWGKVKQTNTALKNRLGIYYREIVYYVIFFALLYLFFVLVVKPDPSRLRKFVGNQLDRAGNWLDESIKKALPERKRQ